MTGHGGADGRLGRRRADMTVAQLAELAGVSAPTVSKVLNGRSGVSAETRQRVEALIRDQGYQRPGYLEPASIIEVVFQALDSMWALEIIRGVEQAASPHGLAVTITDMHGRLRPDVDWVRAVLDRRPVGLIAVSEQITTQHQAQLASRGIPLVVLDPSGEPSHRTPSVGAANWNGGLLAARHLLELGHRRVAMINGSADFVCCRARLDGYRAALDSAGVPVERDLLRVADLHVAGGQKEAARLLRMADPPTAIFAANDLQAIGVYEAARQLEVRIPHELSVVGFDDLPLAQWAGPPLTTVRQPLMQMGAAAADMVLTLAAGRQPEHARMELPTSLVVRQSTAPPAR